MESKKFIAKIITSTVVRAGESMTMYGAVIPRDGQQGKKLKFAEACKRFLTETYEMGIPVDALTVILGSLVEGKGVHLDSVGEFFELYGRLQQKIGMKDAETQSKMMEWMRNALGEEIDQFSRSYERDGRRSLLPLPLYVRNVVAHRGTNPYNNLTKEDLSAAIKMLKQWVL